MHYPAFVRSIPFRPACIFLFVQFLWTCFKLNRLSNGAGVDSDDFLNTWLAAESFRLIATLSSCALFVIVHHVLPSPQQQQQQDRRDADIVWGVFLLCFMVWAVLDFVVVVVFCWKFLSMVENLAPFVFVLALMNTVEPAFLFGLYRWCVRKGKLKIDWGATPKLTEFTDPIQKFVYMHLPPSHMTETLNNNSLIV